MTGQRDMADWALFAALTMLWSSAYAFTHLAVETIPPRVIIPLRLTMGAAILLSAMALTGHRLPALSDWTRWRSMAAMGFVGMAAPFFIITTAQQTVASSLAALYVAATPIFVVIGAGVFFRDEKLTPRSAIGVAIGFVGVAVLFGPSVFVAASETEAGAQALCLLATVFYASSTLIARAAPPMPSIVFSAGFVTLGALMSWPLAIGYDWSTFQPSTASVLALIGLGIGPSALASLAYMALVRRAGPTFLSLTGYAIPLVSALIGYIAFGEILGWTTLIAFALILLGVWLAQRREAATEETEPAAG